MRDTDDDRPHLRASPGSEPRGLLPDGERRDAVPRAEELILEVYRQRTERAGAGGKPSRVVMNRRHYDAIQRYHALLGQMPDGAADYIGRYRLFDLDICVEQTDRIRVE